MSSKKLINQIWDKAHKIRGKNPNIWRRDNKRNIIRRGSYGTKGEYGWEIDHKHPKAKGGSDKVINYQPLHWKANREKGDKY